MRDNRDLCAFAHKMDIIGARAREFLSENMPNKKLARVRKFYSP